MWFQLTYISFAVSNFQMKPFGSGSGRPVISSCFRAYIWVETFKQNMASTSQMLLKVWRWTRLVCSQPLDAVILSCSRMFVEMSPRLQSHIRTDIVIERQLHHPKCRCMEKTENCHAKAVTVLVMPNHWKLLAGRMLPTLKNTRPPELTKKAIYDCKPVQTGLRCSIGLVQSLFANEYVHIMTMASYFEAARQKYCLSCA